MARIAITGGIACGKSLVGSCLAGAGVVVCDADRLVHELMVPGQPVHGEIVAVFGAGILDAEGRIDRAVLGRHVFADPSECARLNAIVHPEAQRAWLAWLDRAQAEPGVVAAAVEVPLLYETGASAGWDAVVCVAARRQTQLARLAARGMSREESLQRIAAQMALPEKMARADYVIVNDSSEKVLREQVQRMLRSILER